jgi:hypothetical protein
MGRAILSVVVGVALAVARCALAVPTFYILQEDTRFIQNGPSSTVGDGFQFLGRATPNDGVGPIDFDGGSISFPATSPLTPKSLAPFGAELDYRSAKIDQTTFQTDYPNGIYTFHLTDSANAGHTQTEAVDSTIVAPAQTVPILSASSFNSLQGMNTGQPITVSFNSFNNPSPSALIFFAIQDAVGNTPVFDGLQPNVTQDTIPTNTLQPGTQYSFFLFFDNIAISADNNAEVLLDNRTQGAFTTAAVPEPVNAWIAILGVTLTMRRRDLPRQ